MITKPLPPDRREPFKPGRPLVIYRGPSTPCPGCWRTNWFVGRATAQCAFCGTVVMLPE